MVGASLGVLSDWTPAGQALFGALRRADLRRRMTRTAGTFDQAARGLTPFVGRDVEVEKLRHALSR
jgi:hypothetical protein